MYAVVWEHEVQFPMLQPTTHFLDTTNTMHQQGAEAPTVYMLPDMLLHVYRSRS